MTKNLQRGLLCRRLVELFLSVAVHGVHAIGALLAAVVGRGVVDYIFHVHAFVSVD